MATSRIGQAVLFWMRWLLLLQMHQGLDPKAQKLYFQYCLRLIPQNGTFWFYY